MDLLCKWCNETKEDVEFLKRNSDLPYSQSNVRCCRKCNAARNRKRYQTDPVMRSKQLIANSRWRKSNVTKMQRYERKHHERFPERQGARFRVQHLLRSGYWTRQPCCVCGSTEQVEAHHDSYAEPHWETVRWLCKIHHEKWHVFSNPYRDKLVSEPLAHVGIMRTEAEKVMAQINELRRQYRKLTDESQDLENATWTKVMERLNTEFPRFLKNPDLLSRAGVTD